MDEGWIKLYRSIWKNPIVTADAEHLAIWIFLLTHASYDNASVLFHGERTELDPGELCVTRKTISDATGASESKVQRVLKLFESEQQIEQRTDRQKRIISILNWDEYQSCEQQNEQRVNNDRTTSEQRVNNDRTTSEQRVNNRTRKEEVKNLRNKEFKNLRNKEFNYYPPIVPPTGEACAGLAETVVDGEDDSADFNNQDEWLEWCKKKYGRDE